MTANGADDKQPALRPWFRAPPAWNSDEADPLFDHVHDRRVIERPTGPATGASVPAAVLHRLGRFAREALSVGLAIGLALFALAIAGGEGLSWRSVTQGGRGALHAVGSGLRDFVSDDTGNSDGPNVEARLDPFDYENLHNRCESVRAGALGGDD